MAAATLTITTGPQRGKLFALDQELIHIGKGPENEIVIQDPGLADHQASIVRRNDRYAIYAPEGAPIEIDGSAIPAERWVWLPISVMINLGGRTTCQFDAGDNGEPAPPQPNQQTIEVEAAQHSSPESPPAATSRQVAAAPTAAGPGDSRGPADLSERHRGSRTKRSSKKSSKKQREVARFITDNAGEALVQLGEDGQLPELTLEEGVERRAKEPQSKQSNPLFLYSALTFSFVASLSMLFIDMEPNTSAKMEQLRARRSIGAFYGDDDADLQAHQILLREARLAYSRNDRAGEREALRRVLHLLNSEDINRFTGLTGKRERDEQLRQLIATLLDDP